MRKITNMWLLLLFCYLVPGSSILTYNGFNSSSTVSIGSVANDSLSFALRTRQENTFILMAVDDPTSSYFKATIENGNLTFTAKYGVNDIVFTGGKINTGTMHAISLLKENNSVSLLIDNIKLTKVSMLFQGFAGILGNSNVSVGKHISDDRLFQGCFGGLNIGGTDIDLKTSSVNMDTLDNCTSSIDSCKPSPCQNDSKCSDDFNDFKCECPAFYTKKTCNETNNVNCAFMPNLCVKGACKNNTFDDPLTRVFSQNGADLFTCECDDGFIGVRCENVTNECEPIPCVNNSTCTDLHLGYNCTCPEGYSGTRCEFLNVELCNTVKPCLNGALCSANVTGYTCECPTDYTGKNCSVSSKSTDDDDDNLPYIIGFSVLAVVILIIIIAVLVARYCRDKSGMEGTYSPNKEEQTAGNVEMGTVKKPKTERLI